MQKKILGSVGFLLVFFLSGLCHADPVGTCSDFFKTFDAMRFQNFAFSPTDCILKASPTSYSLNFRAYLASSGGKLMVFDSYGSGPSSVATGSKVYFFFPRDHHPGLTDQNGQVEFLTANNEIRLKFNQVKAILSEISGTTMTIDHNVDSSTKGGLTILQTSVLMLDSGYLQGGDPTTKPLGQSSFRDANGNTCQVTNKEIFQYLPNGDNRFQFNDQELKDFLRVRCPKIIPGY